MNKKEKIYKKIQMLFKEDDVFWNNEIKANIFVSFCLLILAGILVISYVLTVLGVFDVPINQMELVLKIEIPMILIAIGICRYFKGQKPWIKDMLCAVCLCISVSLVSIISIFVTLIIVVPIVLSCRYYSRKFTVRVTIFTIIGMVISEILYAANGILDLNLVGRPKAAQLDISNGLRAEYLVAGYDKKEYVINLFRGSFAPRFLLLSVIAVICVELAGRAHDMVLEQEEISKKAVSVKTELDMATKIQNSVLPKIFPPFPDKPEIEIYATMTPAKEVGGDFYDYYLLDDDHLLFVIADVSGKGIPGALFMMVSKILIKTYAYIDKSPAVIADMVNKKLYEDNQAELFVTAWIGVLEISTGTVNSIDAGHEYPIIRHGDGSYEVMKDKKSFVLAGMDTAKYKENTFHMDKGDTVFLYTDGVTEATDANNELYGMDRLVEALNENKDLKPKELLEEVRKSIDGFVKDAPQFDDLTMMALKLN